MKKKFLTMLALIFVMPLALLLGACGGNDNLPDYTPLEKKVEYIEVVPDPNNGTLLEHWDEGTQTFTYYIGEFYGFNSYDFWVRAYFDNETSDYVYDFNLNVPEELQNGNIQASETPYEVTIEYKSHSVTVYVKILNRVIAAPTSTVDNSVRTEEYTYDMNPKWFNLEGYSPETMELTEDSDLMDQSDAGDYTIKIRPRDGYVWEDGTTDVLTYNWKIWKQEVAKPQLREDAVYRYNGEWGQGPQFDYENNHGIDYSMCTVEGEDFIEIGEHTTTVTLIDTDNYCWEGEGEDIAPLNFVWTIGKGLIEAPLPTWAAGSELVLTYHAVEYNLKENLNWHEHYNTLIRLVGDVRQTEVALTADKKYEVRAEIIDPTHWEWDKESSTWQDAWGDDPVWKWEITPQLINKPSFAEPINLYYSGPDEVKESGFQLDEYGDLLMNITEDSVLEATDAGTYTITVELKDTRNYCWYYETDPSPVTFEWTIHKLSLYQPNDIGNEYRIFNTQTYYITEDMFDDHKYLTISGETEATKAGTYTVKVNIDTATHGDNVIWKEDSSQNEVVRTWTIKQLGLYPLRVDTSKRYTYTGELQTFAFSDGYNPSYLGLYYSITGNKQTDAIENKTVTATLLHPEDTYWMYDSDGAELTFSWTISPQAVSLPYVVEDIAYVYNTEPQTVSLMNADAEYITVTDNTFTNAGDYVAQVTLNSTNYKWEGKSKDVRTISLGWMIEKCPLVQPTAPSYNFVYSSEYSFHTYMPNGFDETVMNIAGNREALAGSYTAVITIIDTDNYKWGNGDEGAHEMTWSVSRKPVTIPTLKSWGWVYDGIPKTPELESVLVNLMVISGDTTQTDAGSYKIYVSLNNNNYMWEDATTGPQELLWGIAQQIVVTEEYDYLANFTREKAYFYYDGQPKELSLDLSSIEHHEVLEPVFDYRKYNGDKLTEAPSEIGLYDVYVSLVIKEEHAKNYRIYNSSQIDSSEAYYPYSIAWGIVSPTIDVEELPWIAYAITEGETNSTYIPIGSATFTLGNEYLYQPIKLRMERLPGISATYTYEKYNETTGQYEMQYYKEGAAMDMFNETGLFRVTATIIVADEYKDIVTFTGDDATVVAYVTVNEAAA